MPHPLAHPAASVPFTKAGLVLSALVMGSLAPDLWYFIRIGSPFFMYSITGLFLFDLPVGLVMLWFFHALAKWPLLSLLPKGWQRRFYKYAEGFTWGPLKRFGLILLSLLVGSASHIILDSFTHDYGWVVEHVGFFKTPVGGMPLYDLLQNLGSLIGVALLIYWFVRWLPTTTKGEKLAAQFPMLFQAIFSVVTVAVLFLVEAGILYSRYIAGPRSLPRHFVAGGSLFFSAMLILLFFGGIYCLIWTLAFHKTIRSGK
jgi:hypothetical protein